MEKDADQVMVINTLFSHDADVLTVCDGDVVVVIEGAEEGSETTLDMGTTEEPIMLFVVYREHGFSSIVGNLDDNDLYI